MNILQMLSLLLSRISPRREIGTYEVVIHCPHESLTPDSRCHLALTPARVNLLTPVLHYVLNPVGKSRIGYHDSRCHVHGIFNSPIPDSMGSPTMCPCQMDDIDPIEKSWIAIPTCTTLLSPETLILRLAKLLDLLPRFPANGWF
jgi:hypothetical protein